MKNRSLCDLQGPHVRSKKASGVKRACVKVLFMILMVFGLVFQRSRTPLGPILEGPLGDVGRIVGGFEINFLMTAWRNARSGPPALRAHGVWDGQPESFQNPFRSQFLS